jgi:hypothetical protein
MTNHEIIQLIEREILQLRKVFEDKPTLFFTEDDIVCYFYTLLFDKLGNHIVFDKQNNPHALIHKEYPTPFRCDMRDKGFRVPDKDEKTEKNGSFRRGHYDIVVLNPDFITQNDYDVIKAQNYKNFIKEIKHEYNQWSYPPVLYGIEFMFSRDTIKESNGLNRNKAIEDYVKKVDQDTKKLVEAKNINFMNEYKMLVFIKSTSSDKDVRDRINDLIIDYKTNVQIIFDNYSPHKREL